ncbi:hypothetical protein F5Y19DRAFT_212052 [Xylariaceae sp. FL1651]|nr:hypothetical protein F5Y19DRAFT_212052 [Xylariaceae sp. FL1651]
MSSYFDIGDRRSSMVRSPPWNRRMSATESELDPIYRASRNATASVHQHRKQRNNWVLYFLLALVIPLSCILPCLWPNLPSILGQLNNFLPSPTALPYLRLPTSTSLSSPYNLNYTSKMAPFWRNYRDILTTTEDYETWFADVDAGTNAIQSMWAAVPAPTTPHDEAVYTNMQKFIQSRAEYLRLARGEWDGFLAMRDRLVHDMLRSGTTTKRNKGETATATAAVPEEKLQDRFSNQTLAALTRSARRITEELVRAHADLFEARNGALEFAARVHVFAAENAERGFMGRLKSRSLKNCLWTEQLAKALPTLKKRMDKLRYQHEGMKAGLEWLQGQFSRDAEESLSAKDQLVWLKRAKELLQTRAAVLMDVQEGVLFAVRRKELEGKDREKVDYGALWEQWKNRNCGGTSCYDPQGVLSSIKRVFISKKPMAGVAEDEASWSSSSKRQETYRVWRSVYDKACCEDGTFANQLKYASKQPPAM